MSWWNRVRNALTKGSYTEAEVSDLLNKGSSLQKSGKHEKALKIFCKVLNQCPDSYQAYNHRGLVYKTKGDFDRALEDFTSAIAIKPDYAEAYANRGRCHKVKEDYTAALEDFNQALQYKADFAEVYTDRGDVQAHVGVAPILSSPRDRPWTAGCVWGRAMASQG